MTQKTINILGGDWPLIAELRGRGVPDGWFLAVHPNGPFVGNKNKDENFICALARSPSFEDGSFKVPPEVVYAAVEAYVQFSWPHIKEILARSE